MKYDFKFLNLRENDSHSTILKNMKRFKSIRV